MGSYLSKPITAKISVDKSNDKLVCGSSCMQGWRISQEDAHNAILDYDENTSFFAVYDGHGGYEVAQYCEQLLPQFIKETEAYGEGNVEKALIDGFLGFDATIAQPEVIAILKEMAGKKEDEEDSAEEENMSHLFKEASQPIVEVLQKYGTLDHASIRRLRSHENLAKSPMINAKKEDQVSSSSTSYTENGSPRKPVGNSTSSNKCPSGENDTEKDLSNDSITETKHNEEMETVENKDEVNGSGSSLEGSGGVASKSSIPEIKVTSGDSSETKETNSGENAEDKANSSDSLSKNQIGVEQEKPEITVSSQDDNSETQDDKGTPVKNGEACQIPSPNKSKGKSPMKKTIKPQSINSPTDAANQLFKKFLESEDIDDTDDESFVEPEDSSSDEEDSNVKGAASEEDSSDGDEGGDEAEEDEEEEEKYDEEDEDTEFAENIKEEPGSDSGCTAVVAILKGCDLYVANAGDSRCIICRNGEAIDMSTDHKPEEWAERSRIQNAGGKVTNDGRVNGGLNLSRAIGDHAYKQNKELSDREQMITALPDVKKVTINPAEDEFMVLACDGIWNFMTSQEVVDFVRAYSDKDKLSQICEEMFDHCLAPDTLGDGTGCDNMTAIIVRFNNTMKKRSAPALSPEREAGSEAPDTKRQKTDEKKESAVSGSSAASSSKS